MCVATKVNAHKISAAKMECETNNNNIVWAHIFFLYMVFSESGLQACTDQRRQQLAAKMNVFLFCLSLSHCLFHWILVRALCVYLCTRRARIRPFHRCCIEFGSHSNEPCISITTFCSGVQWQPVHFTSV